MQICSDKTLGRLIALGLMGISAFSLLTGGAQEGDGMIWSGRTMTSGDVTVSNFACVVGVLVGGYFAWRPPAIER